MEDTVTQHALLSFTPRSLHVPSTGGVNAGGLCPILLLIIDECKVPETASVWEGFPLLKASVVNVLHKSQSFFVSVDQRQRIVFWIHYEQLKQETGDTSEPRARPQLGGESPLSRRFPR